jgi:hypothetical protein
MGCPRCGGRLAVEWDGDLRRGVPYCLCCGWRDWGPAAPKRRQVGPHWREARPRPDAVQASGVRRAVSAAVAVRALLADGQEHLASECIAAVSGRYGHSRAQVSAAATRLGVVRGRRAGYTGTAGMTWRLPVE